VDARFIRGVDANKIMQVNFFFFDENGNNEVSLMETSRVVCQQLN
jgi:hypothetical protein